MGVKGLYTYVKKYRKDTLYDSVPADPPLRIGFDAMSMLYKYKGNYAEMYPMLRGLKAAAHRLLFVFDGKPPVEKEAEVKERRDIRNSASTHADTLRATLSDTTLGAQERAVLEYSLARLEFQGWHMTREIRHTFQKALWDMDIPYVKAIVEADDALAELVGAGKLDVVVSTDMDFLLSGVPRLWIPFRNGGDGFEEVMLSTVLEGENMTLDMLRDAGILCGVELLRGKVSIQSVMAFSWIRYYKSIEGLLHSTIKEPQFEHLKDAALIEKIRASFVAGTNWKAQIRPDHLERCAAFMEAL
jgi:5'-3' exonuclease